jgi:hypothetical protein
VRESCLSAQELYLERQDGCIGPEGPLFHRIRIDGFVAGVGQNTPKDVEVIIEKKATTAVVATICWSVWNQFCPMSNVYTGFDRFILRIRVTKYTTYCACVFWGGFSKKVHTLGMYGINVLENLQVPDYMGELAKEYIDFTSIATPRLNPSFLATLFCVSIVCGFS